MTCSRRRCSPPALSRAALLEQRLCQERLGLRGIDRLPRLRGDDLPIDSDGAIQIYGGLPCVDALLQLSATDCAEAGSVVIATATIVFTR